MATKQVIAKVKLNPGKGGYFDPITRIHLTHGDSEKPVFAGMNTTNLRKAVRDKRITITSGSLGEFTPPFKLVKTADGKVVLTQNKVDESNKKDTKKESPKAKAKEEKPVEEVKVEEPVVEATPEPEPVAETVVEESEVKAEEPETESAAEEAEEVEEAPVEEKPSKRKKRKGKKSAEDTSAE